MKGLKILGIVGGAIFILCAWWFFTVDTASSSTRSLGTDNRFRGKVKDAAPIVEPSKTEAYQQELKDQQKAIEQESLLSQKDPLNLTSTVQKAMKSPYENRANGTVQPSYVNSSNQVITKETQQEEKPLAVQAAYVPKVKREKPTTIPDTTVGSTRRKFNTRYANTSSDQQQSISSIQEAEQFKASVYGNHEIKPGGIIKFRSTEEVIIYGQRFPRNTLFNGKASFAQERLNVTIDRIPLKEGGYKTVNLVLHDLDLNEGIYAPVSPGKEAAVDETLQGVEQIISSTGTVAGTVGTGLSRVFRSATNGQQKIAIQDSYPVVFIVVADKK